MGQVEEVGESLFYNPAGLAKTAGFKGEPFALMGTMNSAVLSQLGTGMYKIVSLSSYASELQSNPNSAPMVHGGFMTAFGYGGFGFGLLSQAKLIPSYNGADYRYRNKYQLIPAFGIGWRLASGVLRMGYSLQYVNQTSGDVTVDKNTTPLGHNQQLSEGAGISNTFGMTLTFPYVNQPMLNLVARNVANTRFSGGSMVKYAKNKNGQPSTEKMSLDLGFNMMNKLGGKWSMTWSLAYKDMTDTANASKIVHGAAGAELSAGDRVFLRFGFASAYPSAGMGLKSKNASIDFAWYSEELGGGLRSERSTNMGFNFKLRF